MFYNASQGYYIHVLKDVTFFVVKTFKIIFQVFKGEIYGAVLSAVILLCNRTHDFLLLFGNSHLLNNLSGVD